MTKFSVVFEFWEFFENLKAEEGAKVEAFVATAIQNAITEAASAAQSKQDSDLGLVFFILQLRLGIYEPVSGRQLPVQAGDTPLADSFVLIPLLRQ